MTRVLRQASLDEDEKARYESFLQRHNATEPAETELPASRPDLSNLEKRIYQKTTGVITNPEQIEPPPAEACVTWLLTKVHEDTEPEAPLIARAPPPSLATLFENVHLSKVGTTREYNIATPPLP